jgi:hypothetical protein
VEVFEWKSEAAVQEAHHNPVILAMWAKFEEACTCESLAQLEECKGPFPHFEPIDW